MRAWTPARVPSLDGKTVVITGSTSGIGLECAKLFAQKQARVIIAARSPRRAERAVKEVLDSCTDASPRGSSVIWLQCDLTDLRSVKEFAEEVAKEDRPIDVLLNVAGVENPLDGHTAEGFDVTLGTNYWGSFYLTHLLLPRLKEAENSRVVFTTSLSEVHGDVDWSDLPYTLKAMKQSANRMHAVIAVWTKGIAKTDAFRKSDTETKLNAKFLSAFANVFGQNASRGAQSNLYVATAPELEVRFPVLLRFTRHEGTHFLRMTGFSCVESTNNTMDSLDQSSSKGLCHSYKEMLYEESIKVLQQVDPTFEGQPGSSWDRSNGDLASSNGAKPLQEQERKEIRLRS